jgi:hypothetical protein
MVPAKIDLGKEMRTRFEQPGRMILQLFRHLENDRWSLMLAGYHLVSNTRDTLRMWDIRFQEGMRYTLHVVRLMGAIHKGGRWK